MKRKSLGAYTSRTPEQTRLVLELRRSGSSGVHAKRNKDRVNGRRRAIQDSRDAG